MTGLEPANGGITTRCLNHLATPAIYFTLLTYHAVVILVYNLFNCSKIDLGKKNGN